MRLEDLRSFLVVAEAGNLHRAAETLGVTQSALSKTLARIEREAGLPVFERTARGLVLTEAGLSVRHHAGRLDAAMGELEHALADQRHARAGAVRIGCIPYLLSGLVAPLLSRFFLNRPLATFAIETHLTARLLGQAQRGEVDLAVAAVPDAPPTDLEHLALGPLVMQIVSRSEHPRRSHFCALASLAHERWALPAATQHLRGWLEARFAAVGLAPPRVAVESSASPVAFVELLRCSDLLGIMPPRVLAQPVGQGLAAIPCEDATWRHEIAVFWRRGGHLSPMARDFRDALVAYCAEVGL